MPRLPAPRSFRSANRSSRLVQREADRSTNVTNKGWTGNFTSSLSGSLSPIYQDYLFFDSVHPTALAHQLTADIAYHTLTTAPLATSVAMPAVGLAGIGGHETALSFL
jgi:phospholipase/lecithinase/hemolysin